MAAAPKMDLPVDARSTPVEMTELLNRVARGDEQAEEDPLIYSELRRIAAHHLRQEPPDHTQDQSIRDSHGAGGQGVGCGAARAFRYLVECGRGVGGGAGAESGFR
jgi:hypothetical protein